MKRTITMAAMTAILLGAVTSAQNQEGKHKHHKVSELLNALSSEQRSKLHAARDQALKNPAVNAANERRKKADAEFYDKLHQEMERIDPSLKPTLEALSELKRRADEKVP